MAVVQGAYVHGVSTRKVERLGIAAMGKDQVSRLVRSLTMRRWSAPPHDLYRRGCLQKTVNASPEVKPQLSRRRWWRRLSAPFRGMGGGGVGGAGVLLGGGGGSSNVGLVSSAFLLVFVLFLLDAAPRHCGEGH